MGDSARTNTHRCIWLTREQRDNIDRMYGALADPPGTPLRDAIDAWDAAPANPTEAALKHAEEARVELVCALRSPDARTRASDLAAAHRAVCGVLAVLRALGHPDA